MLLACGSYRDKASGSGDENPVRESWRKENKGKGHTGRK